MLEAAERDGDRPAVAIVDAHGELIAFGRADGALRRWKQHAVRKAYTSAIMGRETGAFAGELSGRGRSLADYGDPGLTTLPGGLPLIVDGELVAGIGVTGSSPAGDERLASIGAALAVASLVADAGGDTPGG